MSYTLAVDPIVRQLAAAGMSDAQALVKSHLFRTAAERSIQRGIKVDDKCRGYYVPGRLEFLGKHTDYAGGRSLICAIDRGICLVASPRSDSLVRVVGNDATEDVIFALESGLIAAAGHWSNYPMTVGRRLAKNFPGKLKGADIAFTSDLPMSAGLSSSSALMIAFFLALSDINRLSQRAEYRTNIHSRTDLASYLGTVENGQSFAALIGDRGVGTFGGSEDHTAILLGVPSVLSQYSFCPSRLERQVSWPAGYSMVIAVSGVIAEKTGATQAAYNAASTAARAVVKRSNKQTGRNDATIADAIAGIGIDAVRSAVNDNELRKRFDQFVAESTRIIPAAGDALLAANYPELGILVDESQEFAERLLKNQGPETIYLARSARARGAVAASSFGAGFGGSVWAMVRSIDAEGFIDDWRTDYKLNYPAASDQSSFFTTAAGIPATAVYIATS